MPYFAYYSLTEQGQKKRGYIAAASYDEVNQRLKSRGEYFIRCYHPYLDLLFRKPLNEAHLEEICIHLKEMVQAGIPILDALDAVKQAPPTPQLGDLFDDLYDLIKNGSTFSNAIKDYPHFFDTVFLGVIKAAEKIGDFATAFNELANYYTARQKIAKKIAHSLRYPFLLIGIVTILIAILSVAVVPQIQLFLESFNTQISFSAQILLFIAEWIPMIAINFILFILLGALLLRVLSQTSERMKLFWHKTVLMIPFIGNSIKEIMVLRFFRMAFILNRNEILILESFEISCDAIQNIFIKQRLIEVIERIKTGEEIHQAFSTISFFPLYISRIFRMGALSGNLEPCFTCIIHHYHSTLERRIERFVTYFEPGCLAIIGGFILWIVWVVFIPLYQQITVLDF